MSAEVTAVTAVVLSGLRWAQAGDEAAEHVADLLDQREVAKLGLYLEGIGDLSARVPERVTASEQAALLNDILATVSTATKGIEEVRVARMKSVLAEQRSIQAIFRPLQDALAALEARCKRTLAAWLSAERERVRLEREAAECAAIEAARLQAEAEERAATAPPEEAPRHVEAAKAHAAQVDAAIAAVPREAPRGVKSAAGTTSEREEWTVEVVDAAQVPRQYLDVNVTRLRAAVRSGVREIAGCAITRTTSLQTRTRR